MRARETRKRKMPTKKVKAAEAARNIPGPRTDIDILGSIQQIPDMAR
jgi:hypothetical protein